MANRKRPPLPPAEVVKAVLRYHDVAGEHGRRTLLRLSERRLHTTNYDECLHAVAKLEPRAVTWTLEGSLPIHGAITHDADGFDLDIVDPTTVPLFQYAEDDDLVGGVAPHPARPPARADQILCLIYSPERLEDVAGTMEELFHKVAAQHGPGYAQLWYWVQVGGCVLGRVRALIASVTELVGLKRT